MMVKSDLYDLYFVEKIENKYGLYHYHTENWYDKRDDYKTYFLYRKKIVNETDFNVEILGYIHEREVEERALKKDILKYIFLYKEISIE